MLRCESVSKSYGGRTLFKKISFSIGSGEKIALLGRNGAGKSTLFRMIQGEEEPDTGMFSIPSCYRIGLLAQHAKFQSHSILEEAKLLLLEKDSFHSEEWKAKKILSGLGFSDEQMMHHPKSISGGFTLRLQLAKLLLSDPDLLLLDEPTNYLDIPTIAWLTQFLQNWKKEIITISHDRSFLDAISTHTMGIHREELMKIEGKSSDYFRIIYEQELVYERMVEKRESDREKLSQFITRFGAKASKARQAQSKKKKLERSMTPLEELSKLQELSFSFQEEKTHAKIILEAQNLTYFLPAKKENPTLFSDLSFTISPGDRIALAGRNGVGKSTLLKGLIGEIQLSSGAIITHPSCKIGYFGQTNIERLIETNTIEEEIGRENPDITLEEVRAIMGVMMLGSSFHSKQIGILSGGEKSRVLLAKILANPINLLLLDEPTNHLDIESIEALSIAIEEFQGAVVLVSHSEELLSRLSNKSLIFDLDTKTNKTLLRYYPIEYALFKKEIGWHHEKEREEKKECLNEEKSRFQTRHERALQVQERSKVIKPIKEKIKKIEEQIAATEQKKELQEQELIILSQNQTQERNPYLSISSSSLEKGQKELHRITIELENLYATWEKFEIELEQAEARFHL